MKTEITLTRTEVETLLDKGYIESKISLEPTAEKESLGLQTAFKTWLRTAKESPHNTDFKAIIAEITEHAAERSRVYKDVKELNDLLR
jgi:hypothetical protein